MDKDEIIKRQRETMKNLIKMVNDHKKIIKGMKRAQRAAEAIGNASIRGAILILIIVVNRKIKILWHTAKKSMTLTLLKTLWRRHF